MTLDQLTAVLLAEYPQHLRSPDNQAAMQYAKIVFPVCAAGGLTQDQCVQVLGVIIRRAREDVRAELAEDMRVATARMAKLSAWATSVRGVVQGDE